MISWIDSVIATSVAAYYPDLMSTRTFVHLNGFIIHIIGPIPKTAHALGPISIRYL
jgi:hypothetical protein